MSKKTIALIEKHSAAAHELQSAGRFADAEEPLLMVISLSKLLYGASHLEVLRAEMNLAVSYRRVGKVEEALPILEKVTGALSNQIGDPEGAYLYRMALNNFAASLRVVGELSKAAAALKLCLSLVELVVEVDETAPEEHARVLDNLAHVLTLQGDLDSAAPYAVKALAEWRELRGDQDLDVATSMSHLGVIRMRLGDLVGARELLEQTLAMFETLAGPEHPDVGGALNLVGTLEILSGNLDAAHRHYSRSLDVSSSLPDDHPQVCEAREGLEQVEIRRGQG